MPLGIPGHIGQIAREQLDEQLKQQLEQQLVAQRIKEFEAEQRVQQERLDLDRQQLAGQAAHQGRMERAASNRTGVEEMQLTRAAMDKAERAAQLDALANDPNQSPQVRQLIPLLRAGGISNIPADVLTSPKSPKYRVTVPGAKGEPISKLYREEELEQGVTEYRAPEKPSRTELTPGQAFSAERQLRNEFRIESKAAREVTTQLGLMRAALTAAKQGDMAAGSQGVLVTFQKILDPTSVVRESEYARSAAGQSLLSRIEGGYQRLVKGGAGVPVQELEKFVSLAEQFAKNQQANANEFKKQAEAIAVDYRLDPERITREIGELETKAPPEPGAKPRLRFDAKGNRIP
jgi:hypothetical protein